MKFVWRSLLVIALAVIGLGGYLAFWPVPIDAKRWNAPPNEGYTGAHETNERLADLNAIDLKNGAAKPEHVAVGPANNVYTAVKGGRILRMDPDGSDQEVYTDTGGRVLGFDFTESGDLIAADAYQGLLRITSDGSIETLLTVGETLYYPNAVTVAEDGRVYLTDSTRRFEARDWGIQAAAVLAALEQSATGRVLEYDPSDGKSRVVAKGMAFANGLVLGSDGHELLVAETARYRVWAIDRGARGVTVSEEADASRKVLAALPGLPDNLTRGDDGRIWLGLVEPRTQALDDAAETPFFREMMLRLPSWIVQQNGQQRGHVIAFDKNGEVLRDLQDPSGRYGQTTGATEAGDRLYVHNVGKGVLGWRSVEGL